jgi:hypothetical protein
VIATKTSHPVSARSPTALMSLGAQAGDVIRIEADGAAAAIAVDRIVALVRDGFRNSRAPTGSVRTRASGRTSPTVLIRLESVLAGWSAQPYGCPIRSPSPIRASASPKPIGRRRSNDWPTRPPRLRASCVTVERSRNGR